MFIDSPAEDEIVETWSTQVSGRVEGDHHLVGLHYEVDGHGLGMPAIAGPFSFTVWTDRRPEVRVAVQARSEDCVVRAERVLHFDTSRWVELMQDGAVLEMNVAAPGAPTGRSWARVPIQAAEHPFYVAEWTVGSPCSQAGPW